MGMVTVPRHQSRASRTKPAITIGVVVVLLLIVAYVGLSWQRWLMPAGVVSLTGTTWQVASVDGTPVSDAKATVSFTGKTDGTGAVSETRAALTSACGSRLFGYDWDSSDSSIEFWPISAAPRPCLGEAAAHEQMVATALPLVDHWAVDSTHTIQLNGSSTIVLRR